VTESQTGTTLVRLVLKDKALFPTDLVGRADRVAEGGGACRPFDMKGGFQSLGPLKETAKRCGPLIGGEMSGTGEKKKLCPVKKNTASKRERLTGENRLGKSIYSRENLKTALPRKKKQILSRKSEGKDPGRKIAWGVAKHKGGKNHEKKRKALSTV